MERDTGVPASGEAPGSTGTRTGDREPSRASSAGAEVSDTRTDERNASVPFIYNRGCMLRIVMVLALAPVVCAQPVSWRDALRQPAAWYGSAEAVRIADNLLLYQHDIGGWDKNIDMARELSAEDRARLEKEKHDPASHSTIDNSSTYTQMDYLARVYTATRQPRFAAAVRKGFEYLMQAQYPNGGWPQFYPLRHGYWDHITYNDDAMVGVLDALRGIVNRAPEYAFLGDAERARARLAMARGIECILKTQVTENGRLTAWCAQHDEKTLAPAKARAYEHPSLSGAESVASSNS